MPERHAVIVTAGRVDPEGDAAENSAEAFGPLAFVDGQAADLRQLLQHEHLGYTVDHLTEARGADLDRIIGVLKRGNGILHFLGHGAIRSDELHFVPATGDFSPLTSMAQWCKELNTRAGSGGPHYLLVLDLCRAEYGLRGQKLGDIDNVWLACAAGDQPAYKGWFSQALAETLRDLSRGEIDVDASFEFVPMRRFQHKLEQQYARILNDADLTEFEKPRAHFLGHFSDSTESTSGRVPLFPNRYFNPKAAVEQSARADVDASLHPFLDVRHFADRAGPHFTGRDSILAALGQWRAGRQAGSGLYVVTGAPGSGKSAIAAAIVLTCHPGILASHVYAESAQTLQAQLPTACRIGVTGPVAAVHARQRRLEEVTRSFIEQLHGQGNPKLDQDRVSSVTDLAEWVKAQIEPPLFVLDALDEAVKPEELVHVLLRPLLAVRRDSRPACRVLVAGRHDTAENQRLLDLLEQSSAGPLRVDLDTHDQAELRLDLEAFLTAALPAVGQCCTDRVPSLAKAIADALVERVERREYGPFLVASLYANYLGRLPHRGSDASTHFPADADSAARPVPRSLPEVLELDFGRIDDPAERRRQRSVLAALAFAYGEGMPAAIAGMLAVKVFGGGAGLDATAMLHDSAGIKVYLRSTTDPDGTPLYRLFHQGLNDYLRQRPIAEGDRA